MIFTFHVYISLLASTIAAVTASTEGSVTRVYPPHTPTSVMLVVAVSELAASASEHTATKSDEDYDG